jgi:small subunit ribosomal protein S18
MKTVTRRRDNRETPQNGDRKAGVSSRRFASQKRSSGGIRDQAQCRFCKRGDKYIDYKDIDTLQRLLTNRGKIYSRKRSGNCASCQRKAKRAIKRARYMALLPFAK